ncbi:MAG TPA: YidC/Oxa1 family membrane protein insertase [Actinomycetota bacterium]|nr:YidC/Oxa1 family membrane protein insertase [Actinomycetota bacterium]
MGFFELFSTALAGFYAVIPSYGLAIILLTLAVRLLLLPLSIKQTKSMREMQAIQPEIKRLQAKHKGDRQKMNEELMALYKEHGVNPFGGCLPLLMQFPILIGLFYVIRTPLRYMGEVVEGSALADGLRSIGTALDINQFLGIRLNCSASGTVTGNSATGDLSQLDRALADACGSGVVTALPYLLLVLLMGFTTYYQQKQMQKSTPNSPQAQQMQMFAKIMPLMLMVFSFNFPAGVVIYWVTTNLWTIVQQRIILAAHPLPVAAGGPGPKTPKAPKNATPTTAKAAKAAKATSGNSSKTSSDGAKTPATASSKPHPSSKKKRKK